MWWETLPAQLTMWAAATAALIYLLKLLLGGAEFIRRLLLALHLLGDTKRYPNGSTDLLGSLNSIYDKQGEMASVQDRILEEMQGLSQRLEEHVLYGRHA